VTRLAGEGLVLRPFGEDDIPAIVDACRDEDVVRWTSVPSPYSEDDAREFLRSLAPEAHAFAITDGASGEYLGSIDVRPETDGRASVGYLVRREARGRGVASRALRLVSRWALAELGLARVTVLVEPENVASQRVAERAGFVREGVVRSWAEVKGTRRDYVVFSLLPADLS
jgi:RimJ/RimL family protein N-acetyltransferase